MRTRPLLYATSLLAAVIAAGCGGGLGALDPACGTSYGAAVSVVARDARTEAWLPAVGSRGVAIAGARSDSLRPVRFETPEVRTLLGGDREGVYAVRLERPGYATWEQGGVAVSRNVCGVVTVGLVADLQPAP
jgi:hypothetical protein